MKKDEHPLRITAAKILENWGMMMVDEPSQPLETLFVENEPLYRSLVELQGVVSGTVAIIAQSEFISALACNVLGESDESQLNQRDREDAFRELGNILAGNFITEAYGDDVVFDLLNPSVTNITQNELGIIHENSIVFEFLADNAPVAFSFDIKATVR